MLILTDVLLSVALLGLLKPIEGVATQGVSSTDYYRDD